MTMVTLIPKKTGARGQRYDVRHGDEIIVADSRDPEHDAARVLLARGVTGRMTTVDEQGRPRMHVDIAAYAERRTAEGTSAGPRDRKWELRDFTAYPRKSHDDE